jgi:isopentenyl diphosphate isomerase/L-lactate dehydrogenase-like FMN-dependent dehydrogenase
MFANIWGEAGVSRLINLFSQEMKTSMQLMGVANVNQLNSSYVRDAVFPRRHWRSQLVRFNFTGQH